jgi:flavin-binding protein dodecin
MAAPRCFIIFRQWNRSVRLSLRRGSNQAAGSQREDVMADSVYKVIELIGTSKDSWEKAAKVAVDRASKSLRDLRVAEVVQLDMQLDAKGRVEAYRAKVKVSFKFEGS